MAQIANPKTLDLGDIQGMVTRGYASLYETAYLHLTVLDAQKTKSWLTDILPLIDSADHTIKSTQTLHIAFARNGLAAIGLHPKNISNFPIPFREGVSTENRNRILGDYGENAPENWNWGAQNDEQILLIFHAVDSNSMEQFLASEKERITQNGGLAITRKVRGDLGKDNKEPFGFHDGISQPIVKGCGKKGPEMDVVETGEFLLGYKNERNQFPFSPYITEEQGDMSLLKTTVPNNRYKDLGFNGTFMVFRQMQQHVDEFWQAMENHTKNPDGSVNEEAKIRLAAKCVGRWPSGASLVNFPEKDPGGSHENDDFGYADKDPDGMRCPLGSHLRRNNPRDSFRYYDKKQSIKISKRHRIIRRGRKYKMPAENSTSEEVGLHFVCFNTDIELQFEFIQHVWSNNNQLDHLSNDIDVIIGVPNEGNPDNDRGKFTVQNEPVDEFYEGWKRFVTIRGGAYYFFPSISAIRYLSTI